MSQEQIDFYIESISLGLQPNATDEQIVIANSAREALTVAYIPLARKEANRYARLISKEEAESAAYLGLAIAIRSWNPNKGALSSWARLYIKNTLMREVNRQSLIKIPQKLAPKQKQVNELKKLNKDIEYISKETKLTKKEVMDLIHSPAVVVWLDDENNKDIIFPNVK